MRVASATYEATKPHFQVLTVLYNGVIVRLLHFAQVAYISAQAGMSRIKGVQAGFTEDLEGRCSDH